MMIRREITYLQVPCAITRNPVAVHTISGGVKVSAGSKLNVFREERILEEEIDRCDWVAIV